MTVRTDIDAVVPRNRASQKIELCKSQTRQTGCNILDPLEMRCRDARQPLATHLSKPSRPHLRLSLITSRRCTVLATCKTLTSSTPTAQGNCLRKIIIQRPHRVFRRANAGGMIWWYILNFQIIHHGVQLLRTCQPVLLAAHFLCRSLPFRRQAWRREHAEFSR